MRITGGRARGIPLKTPTGGKVRPAMDATREAVFSHLGSLVEGARVLDLFAGTGAYGLEALSRGAASVTFVEQDARALAHIKKNLSALEKSLGRTPLAQVSCSDVFRWQSGQAGIYDFIFVDPPYSLWESHSALILSRVKGWLSAEAHARLLLECPGGFEPEGESGLQFMRRLGKGKKQPSVLIYSLANKRYSESEGNV